MAKNSWNDYSTTPLNNSDIGGITILGTSPVRNFDDALREGMSQTADVVAGTSPVADTMTWNDPTDDTKKFRTDAGDIPTGTTRVLNAEVLYRQGAYIETIYTASGTHTFATSSRFFQIEGTGGGAGGGGVDGQGASTQGTAAGGGSGFFGRTGVITKGAILTGTVVVGTGGAGGAGASGTAGSDGVSTTWSDGVNSFTWGRGRGGDGMVATSGTPIVYVCPTPAQSAGALIGTANYTTNGVYGSPLFPGPFPNRYRGGNGASSSYGTGGQGGLADTGTASGAAGSDGVGYGSGGGGAAVVAQTTNYSGGAGAPGLLIVREW